MVKVIVNNGQYKITVPKDVVEAKGWSSDTRIMVVMDAEGNLVLKEIIEKRGRSVKK